MLFALLPGFSLHSCWKEQGDAKVTAEGRAGGWCVGKGGLSCLSHLHVSRALDDSTGALPVPAVSGAFPGQSYRVCGHLERACSGSREGCQGLAVRLVEERVFSEEHKCFSTEGIRSRQHQISPADKISLSPCFRASHPFL